MEMCVGLFQYYPRFASLPACSRIIAYVLRADPITYAHFRYSFFPDPNLMLMRAAADVVSRRATTL